MKIEKQTQLQAGRCSFCTRENKNVIIVTGEGPIQVKTRFCYRCLWELFKTTIKLTLPNRIKFSINRNNQG